MKVTPDKFPKSKMRMDLEVPILRNSVKIDKGDVLLLRCDEAGRREASKD